MSKIPLLLTILFLHAVSWAQCDPPVGIPPSYGFVLGTQTFNPAYKFYAKYTPLEETARAILGMGSSYLKISLDPDNFAGYGITKQNGYEDPTTLLKSDSSFRNIMQLPFTKYFFWVRSHNNWRDWANYSIKDKANDSIALDSLVTYLLNNPTLAGKQFYLGHWEGDWYLNPVEYKTKSYVEPLQSEIDGMKAWLNMRHQAIATARARFPNSPAKVWDYVELNKVVDAFQSQNRRKRVVNEVLPDVEVDLVSCSCYDLKDLQKSNPAEFFRMLDSIQGRHKHPTESARPKFAKSVFIGEFGYPASDSGYNDSLHELVNRQFFRSAVAWGAPMVLYWEIYNNKNERDPATNWLKGFWLVTNTNHPTALYSTMKNFYHNAQNWVDIWRYKYGKEPTFANFQYWTSNILKKPVKGNVVQSLSEYLHTPTNSDTTLVDPHLFAPLP